MTCKHCEASKTDISHRGMTVGCKGCTLRGLAASQAMKQSLAMGRPSRHLFHPLMGLFQGDKEKGWQAVKAEARRLKLLA